MDDDERLAQSQRENWTALLVGGTLMLLALFAWWSGCGDTTFQNFAQGCNGIASYAEKGDTTTMTCDDGTGLSQRQRRVLYALTTVRGYASAAKVQNRMHGHVTLPGQVAGVSATLAALARRGFASTEETRRRSKHGDYYALAGPRRYKATRKGRRAVR